MTIEEAIIKGASSIPKNEAKILLSFIMNYDLPQLLNHLDEKISTENVNKYFEYIKKVAEGYPIQYLVGSVNFFGFEFYVNKNVLIPRFETEELVENTLEYIKNFFPQNAKVIDLGCGSGAIGITLKKKMPTLDVTCLDISEEALDVTRKNAKNLNADIKIIKGDMLKDINEAFDIVISNPPYIDVSEEIDEKVRAYEPSLALFAPSNGLYFYENILSNISKVTNDKYLIAFEIGHLQKEGVLELANKYLDGNFTFECKKDLSNRDRMIFIYKI